MDITVMIACNNGRGRFQDAADAVHIDGPGASRICLEMGQSMPFEMERGRFRFGRTWDGEPDDDDYGDCFLLPDDAPWFAYQSDRNYVGNLCWHAFHMEPKDALALLERLRADGWDCTEAATETFHKWRNRAICLDLTDLGLEVAELLPGRDYPDPHTLDLFAA